MKRRTKRLLSAIGHDVVYAIVILSLLLSLKAFWSANLIAWSQPTVKSQLIADGIEHTGENVAHDACHDDQVGKQGGKHSKSESAFHDGHCVR